VEADEPARASAREPAPPISSEQTAEESAVSNDGSQDAAGDDSRHQGKDPQRALPNVLDKLGSTKPSTLTTEPGAPGATPDAAPEAASVDSAEAADSVPETTAARATSASGTTPAPGLRGEAAAFSRPVLSAAWLQKLGEAAPRAAAGTWQSVQLSLGEGDGELTVRARRDEERVRVAIGFSDPNLRLLATEQADRLQSALEARYGTDVDLSFTDGEREQAGERGEPGLPRATQRADATDATDAAPSHAPARSRPGSSNEWVG
jgi:hypothetical protein